MTRCSPEKKNAPSRQKIKVGEKSINYNKTRKPENLTKTIKNVAQKINKILIKTSLAVYIRGTSMPVKSIHKKPYKLIVEMLIQKKFTDGEILSELQNKFGTGSYMTKPHAIHLVRSEINKGTKLVPEGCDNIGRIVIDNEGNRKMLPYIPSCFYLISLNEGTSSI